MCVRVYVRTMHCRVRPLLSVSVFERAKGGKVEAMVRASASGKHSPKKTNCLARKARRRPAQNLPRNTRLSTFTGRKKLDREEIQRVWSGDRPPPGTTQ